MRFGKPQKRKGAVPSAVRVVLRRAASLKNARSFRAAGPAPAAPVGSRGSRSLPFVNRAEERFCDAGECRPRGPLRSAGCGQLRQGMKDEVSGGRTRSAPRPEASLESLLLPSFAPHPTSSSILPKRRLKPAPKRPSEQHPDTSADALPGNDPPHSASSPAGEGSETPPHPQTPLPIETPSFLAALAGTTIPPRPESLSEINGRNP